MKRIDIESLLTITKEHMRRRGLPKEIIESVLEDVRNDADLILEQEPASLSSETPANTPTPTAPMEVLHVELPEENEIKPLKEEIFSTDFGDEGNSPAHAAALADLADLPSEPKPKKESPIYDSFYIVCSDPENSIPNDLRMYFEGFLIKCVSGTSPQNVPSMLKEATKNMNSLRKFRRDPLTSIGVALAEGPTGQMSKAGFRVVNRLAANVIFVDGKI